MSDLTPFVTLARPCERASVIGGSDFLTYAARADTPEDALELVKGVRARHPDATHVCWAYRVRGAYRFSDDGEPGGTAGAPMLRAIEGQGVDRVVVAVARYYGGTKLGTGGLARAYGGETAETLRTAERETVRPRVQALAEVPFGAVSALYHLLTQFDLVRGEETYTERGLSLPLALYPDDVDPLRFALTDATRGSGALTGPESDP